MFCNIFIVYTGPIFQACSPEVAVSREIVRQIRMSDQMFSLLREVKDRKVELKNERKLILSLLIYILYVL